LFFLGSGGLLVYINLYRHGEIDSMQITERTLYVSHVVKFNPGFNKVVICCEHDEIFAHSLRLKTGKEGVHLGGINAFVLSNLVADEFPLVV
jgi:hypothetical protein